MDRRIRGIVVTIAVAAALVWTVWFVRTRRAGAELAPRKAGLVRVRFLEVGYGDCAWISFPGGANILIDGGPGPSGKLNDHGEQLVFDATMPKKDLAAFLRGRGVKRIDAAVVSHAHYDHWGGLAALVAGGSVPVTAVYESSRTAVDAAYKEFRAALAEKGVPVIGLEVNDRIPTGEPDATLTVLGPRADYDGSGADVANRSLILKLSFGQISALFTGDAQEVAEFDLLKVGSGLKSTLLKVADHASPHATSTPFLDWVHPEVAVISVDTPNPFGTPHDDTIQKLLDRDIEYYRTDTEGDVVFVTDGKRWKIDTER